MELKYGSSSVIIKTQISSNRTFMELKLTTAVGVPTGAGGF